VKEALQLGCLQRKDFADFFLVGVVSMVDDGDMEWPVRGSESLLSELLSSMLSLSLNPFTGEDEEWVRWWDTRADFATKVDVQPGKEHLKGLSPVCVR